MSIMFIDFAFAHILGEREMYVHTVSNKKLTDTTGQNILLSLRQDTHLLKLISRRVTFADDIYSAGYSCINCMK